MKRPNIAMLVLALSLAPSWAEAQTKIYIDPGHGGADFGAVNATHGTREANRVLVTGLELRRLLEEDTKDKTGGGAWSVRMSRSTDIFIPLGARSGDANAWGADRLLSIHQNAYNLTANGTETFSISGTGSAAQLRDLVQAEALKAWGRVNRGSKTAGFSVLRNSAMPAVLTEMGFIDSTQDHGFCASDDNCKLYAKHMMFALQKHYGLKEFVPGSNVPTVIVDNLSPTGYSESGSWETSLYKGSWATDARWANAMDQAPPNTATFRPNLAEAGKYEVAAWWLSGANRSAGAAFTVNHVGGSATVSKDQRSGAKQWNVLGTFEFAAGSDGYVTLSSAGSDLGTNPAATVISADAVRFVRVGDLSTPVPPTPPDPNPNPNPDPTPSPSQEIVIDNTSPDFSAPGKRWFTATHTPGYLGTNYHARRNESTSDPASWSAKIATAAKFEVFARWPTGANRTEAAPFVVLHQGGSTTKYVNQRKDNNTWVSLGTYDFAAGYAPRVLLSCWTRSGDFVIADAVKFVKK